MFCEYQLAILILNNDVFVYHIEITGGTMYHIFRDRKIENLSQFINVHYHNEILIKVVNGTIH